MALSVGTGQWANPLKSSLPSCPIISQSWQLMETKRQHTRLLGITLDSSRNTVFCYHSQAIHFPPTLHCGMVFSPQLLVLITWGDITSHLDLKKSKNVLHLIAFNGWNWSPRPRVFLVCPLFLLSLSQIWPVLALDPLHSWVFEPVVQKIPLFNNPEYQWISHSVPTSAGVAQGPAGGLTQAGGLCSATLGLGSVAPWEPGSGGRWQRSHAWDKVAKDARAEAIKKALVGFCIKWCS